VAKALLKFSFIDAIRDTLDFCGLNYYGAPLARPRPRPRLALMLCEPRRSCPTGKEITRGGSIAIRDDEEYSESGRVVYPAGLYSLLKDFDERRARDPTEICREEERSKESDRDRDEIARGCF